MKKWLKIKQNPHLWKKYFLREKIIQTIREFFLAQRFHEVETPLLVSSVIPESYLEVFETYLLDRKGKKKKMFFTTSPEASIKKLLVAGIGNCFEITKSFRNKETESKLHSPEFTILEWYRIDATYKNIMKDCENLLIYLNNKLNQNLAMSTISLSNSAKNWSNRNLIKYQKNIIDLSSPWERISMRNAFKKYAGICLDEIIEKKSSNMFPVKKIAEIARQKGYCIENNTWEEIFNQIFLNEIEPHLGTHGKPTIIYDYPKIIGALAKTKKDNPCFVERFEFYIGGLEIGDCYTELTDYKENKKRFISEIKKIKEKKKTSVIADQDFLHALKEGLPPCSGIAIGIDRLVMLFLNSLTIDDTLLFP